MTSDRLRRAILLISAIIVGWFNARAMALPFLGLQTLSNTSNPAKKTVTCSSVISDSILQQCFFLSPRISFGEETHGCTWTCSDALMYCTSFIDSGVTYAAVEDMTVMSRWYLVPAGIVGNLLLFLTLLSPALSGSTFMFLRFIAVCQLLQGVLVMLSIQGLFPESVELVLAGIGSQLAVMVKMTVSMAALFLTLDRCLAVCLPAKYAVVSNRKFTWVAFGVSLVVGSIQLVSLAEYSVVESVVENRTRYELSRNSFGRRIDDEYLLRAIAAIRVTILVLMLLLGSAIIVQLLRRDRKVTGMMSSEAALKEHREMILLCRFQAVDTAVMIMDVGLSTAIELTQIIWWKFIKELWIFTLTCSLSERLWYLKLKTAGLILQATANVLLALAHGHLFFIYLIFFRKFRKAFLGSWRSLRQRCGTGRA